MNHLVGILNSSVQNQESEACARQSTILEVSGKFGIWASTPKDDEFSIAVVNEHALCPVLCNSAAPICLQQINSVILHCPPWFSSYFTFLSIEAFKSEQFTNSLKSSHFFCSQIGPVTGTELSGPAERLGAQGSACSTDMAADRSEQLAGP